MEYPQHYTLAGSRSHIRGSFSLDPYALAEFIEEVDDPTEMLILIMAGLHIIRNLILEVLTDFNAYIYLQFQDCTMLSNQVVATLTQRGWAKSLAHLIRRYEIPSEQLPLLVTQVIHTCESEYLREFLEAVTPQYDVSSCINAVKPGLNQSEIILGIIHQHLEDPQFKRWLELYISQKYPPNRELVKAVATSAQANINILEEHTLE